MSSLCTQCGFDNLNHMRFCGNCGAHLRPGDKNSLNTVMMSNRLPTKGLGIMMGADLAKRLKETGIDAKGQRRTVTVLFMELIGYTTLSGHADDEDLFEFIQRYMQQICENVYKYEGIVDKLTGDGIIALFGAPISHENNAELAVRAALDIQTDTQLINNELREHMGIEIEARIGLHSGAVVVGGIGSDLMMDYTAVGDTVFLARHIKEVAPPGTIFISESVYRQIRTIFDCQPANELTSEDVPSPIQAFCVTGIKIHPETSRGIEGLHAPMIGRDHELVRLKLMTNRVIESQQGQFVLVTGEAGIGKTRLIAELISWIYSGNFTIRIIKGHSLAYRRTIPYWIIREIIYSYLGLTESAPKSEISHQLVRCVSRALHLQAQRTLPFLEKMLAIPFSDQIGNDLVRQLDPRQLRQQTYLAVRDLFVAEANNRPLMIILDDLHWADEASLDLIGFLLKAIKEAPIFFLAISRTHHISPLKEAVSWADQNLEGCFEHIDLHSLSLIQSERLFALLLSIRDLPDEMRENILQRASGIPFYLEEILRMLIDQGVIQRENGQWRVMSEIDAASFGVPATVQELILTRFDRLGQISKLILQVASVIGKDFDLAVLRNVLSTMPEKQFHDAIVELENRDFIIAQSNEVKGKYSFRHILMSDAIYRTILRKERRELHGQVGDVIEKLYAVRLDEHVELLANHYRWSDHLDRAFHYVILAGQKASQNYLNEQAHESFKIAIEILPEINPSTEQVMVAYIGMGDSFAFRGEYDQARDQFRMAKQIIDQKIPIKNAEVMSGLFRKIAKTYERQGEYDQAITYLWQAQDALDSSALQIPIEQAEVWNDLGWIHFRRGNFSEAGDLFLQALNTAEEANALRVIASILNRLGGVAYHQGDWESAARYLRRSILIREKTGDVIGLASSTNNLGNLEIEMGEFDHALENLNRNLELVQRLGQVEGIAVAYNNLGWLHTLRGELDEAKNCLIEALELALKIGYTSLVREVTKNIGELYLVMEDYIQAREALTEVAPAFEELGANDQLLHVYRMLGETALGFGELEVARNWSNRLDEIVARFGDDTLQLPALHWGEVLRFRGELAIHSKDYETAERYLKVSANVFIKLKSQLYLGRTLYQQGNIAVLRLQNLKAMIYYQEAADLFEQIGAKLDARKAREAMATIEPSPQAKT